MFKQYKMTKGFSWKSVVQADKVAMFFILSLCFIASNAFAGTSFGFEEGRDFLRNLMNGDFGAMIMMIACLLAGIGLLWWDLKKGGAVIGILFFFLILPDGVQKLFTATMPVAF